MTRKNTTPYEVSGTRKSSGAIVEENFAEVIEARSSREAYFRILNQPGYEWVNVIAIKIECPTCAGFHLTIPTQHYK